MKAEEGIEKNEIAIESRKIENGIHVNSNIKLQT